MEFWRKKYFFFLGVFGLTLFLGLILPGIAKAALSCEVTTAAACTDTVIFRMSDATNAHAELPSQTTPAYDDNVICCTGVEGLGNSCSGIHAVVGTLSGTTNAHFEQNDKTNYSSDNDVCLSVTSGTVSVGYQSGNCNGYDETVASMSGTSGTNAHVGNADAYTTKICASAYYAVNAVTVGTVLTQPTYVPEGATDVVMGAFTFVAAESTATVTSIKISEKGTVNANSNLSNAKIYYQEEAICTFEGSTATSTPQSFNSSDEATFSGLTLPIGTTTTCVFVVLDVGADAGVDNTIEIEITSVTDVSITDGYPYAPSWPVKISGTTTIQLGFGTVMSTEVDFDWVPDRDSWGEVIWSTTETQGDVKLKVYYTSSTSTACDTLVSTSTLPGNDVGFATSASPLDISGLTPVATTYNKICLKAELTAGASQSPTLDDWKITWEPPAVPGAPTVINVQLNSQVDIDLIENSTSSVSATADVSDAQGCNTITSVTAKIYRSGVTNRKDCTTNENNCYSVASCTETSCSETDAVYACTISMQFHADPTDGSSEYWRAWIQATDVDEKTGSNYSPAEAPDVNTLRALNITGSINYGSLDPGQNTTSTNQQITVTVTGNEAIDVRLYGADMTWSSNTIDTSNQKYSLSPFDYNSGGTILKEGPGSYDDINADLPKPTQSPSNSSDIFYWGLGIPSPMPSGGPYQGTNTFEAINAL